MVDEPITDLCHRYASSLSGSQHRQLSEESSKRTLENIAFCSSLGYGFAMFWDLGQLDERILGLRDEPGQTTFS